METKIIKAVFGGSRYTVAAKRTRTDYGQVLEISGVDLPSTFECIFSNSATSAGVGKKMIGSAQRVLIPDEYLTTGQTIYAWILLHDTEDDGRHMYNVKIPVADMPDLSPEEPTPVEQSIISQAITALNSAVETTAQKASEASASADRAEQAAEGVEGYAERAESAQQAAESARDRATQAETSARTSAATASEKASEAISSATTASQSALTAESASESAQEYATESAESASQASQSAESASESASASAGNANFAASKALDASNSASEAAQSAQAAVQAKTDAESAKTASETAQGLAETAQGAAEDARDEAQDIVDGITNKVEQIDKNTADIASLESDRYKPYAVDSASGSIASFPDGADNIPLKSCIVQIEPVQAGEGDPSPENERPITGWTGADVTRCGKNLFDKDNVNALKAYIANDKVTTNSNHYCVYISCKPNTTYTVQKICVGSGDQDRFSIGYTVEIPSNDAACYGIIHSTSASRVQGQMVSLSITTGQDAKYLICWISYSTGYADSIATFQLELGSTPTSYEPYTGRTYPITFPTEAGTIYGGYVDVTGGELVVDMAIVDMGTLTWSKYGSSTIYYTSVTGKAVGNTNIISDTFFLDAVAIANMANGSMRGYSTNSNVYFRQDECADLSAWTTWLTNHHPQLCYELAEPIHYPITPNQINSIYGQNNIWADTGDSEVEYRADTKLYIEKLTQPEEDDMVADSAIASGQFFMIGNSLYRALANIASGATITVGTNAERVSLSDALNLVNA